MSDTDPTPEAVDTTAESTDTASEPTEAAPEPTDTTSGDKAAREAAKYRRKLREVEAERDRLAQQVEDLLRAEIGRLSYTRHNVKGAALWAAGYTAADLVGEDGLPDLAKVDSAAEEVAARFGIKPGTYVPAEGKTPSYPLGGSITWDKVLHPNRP